MKEQWVILTFWPHEPTEVYGVFSSQREALAEPYVAP
jgi:hypothetical protein